MSPLGECEHGLSRARVADTTGRLRDNSRASRSQDASWVRAGAEISRGRSGCCPDRRETASALTPRSGRRLSAGHQVSRRRSPAGRGARRLPPRRCDSGGDGSSHPSRETLLVTAAAGRRGATMWCPLSGDMRSRGSADCCSRRLRASLSPPASHPARAAGRSRQAPGPSAAAAAWQSIGATCGYGHTGSPVC